MAAAAGEGLPVAEYAARFVKKAIVGTGSAEKGQIGAMVRRLLPGIPIEQEDAADALAVAICHAHDAASRRRWVAVEAGA
jgi:crossover junction endodeoxyribonuclease RuvC